MSVVISLTDERQETWVPIKFPQGEFEIAIRPPTFEDLCADNDRIEGVTRGRLESCVVNWRGLNQRVMDTTDPNNHVESSQPIPFSIKDFFRLCTAHPLVFEGAAMAVNRMYRGLDPVSAKN